MQSTRILYAEAGGQQKPLRELPLVKHFAPSGVAMLRSGWDLSEKSTDTVAAFYCRPFEAHAHFDAGHFALWRGLDKLVDSARYYWSTEIPYHHCFYTRTVAHNCVLIHQPGEKFQHGPFICNDGGQVQGDGKTMGKSFEPLKPCSIPVQLLQRGRE